MAEYNDEKSMMRDALQEMIEVARYCIEFEKNKDSRWIGDEGCYGFPGALLLLSIVDALGTIIVSGSTANHFKILNHRDYYDLNLSNKEIDALYKDYRCRLSHNARISKFVVMHPGNDKISVLEYYNDGRLQLNLFPFLYLSEKVIKNFLSKQ